MSLLLVGHYSHDCNLTGSADAWTRSECLGGSVAYAGAILELVGESYCVASHVGEDFRYAHELRSSAAQPRVIAGTRTTRFVNQTRPEARRCEAVGAPIRALDLPTGEFEVSLAVGIAGEVLPETLVALRAKSRFVLADAQGLLRVIDPVTQAVSHRPLHETPYWATLGAIDFLKASRTELPYLDRARLPATLTLIVTEGAQGATLYPAGGANNESAAQRVPAFPAEEIDPTGAGDSFLAGVAVGIRRGLPLAQAIRLGNRTGALAVAQIGIPRYSHSIVAGGLLEMS